MLLLPQFDHLALASSGPSAKSKGRAVGFGLTNLSGLAVALFLTLAMAQIQAFQSLKSRLSRIRC